jgi:leader peptidase (prepilin peptidase)/N-methyltransferase
LITIFADNKDYNCIFFGVFGVITFKLMLVTLFLLLLIVLSVIDIKTMLLPDAITFPLIGLGLAANFGEVFVPFTNALLGAGLGYGLLWSVYWIFRLLREVEGMGYGDFKLMAALGAWLGWEKIPLLTLVSAAAALGFTLLLIVLKQRKIEQPFPFGPYLAIAGILTMLVNL